MTPEEEFPATTEQNLRERLNRARLSVPVHRVKERAQAVPSSVERLRGEGRLAGVGKSEYLAVKGALHERLLNELNSRSMLGVAEDALAAAVRDFVQHILAVEELPLNEAERKQLAEDLIEETVGVGPLAPLMADPAVTDILVNGPDQVYIERFGRLEADRGALPRHRSFAADHPADRRPRRPAHR